MGLGDTRWRRGVRRPQPAQNDSAECRHLFGELSPDDVARCADGPIAEMWYISDSLFEPYGDEVAPVTALSPHLWVKRGDVAS